MLLQHRASVKYGYSTPLGEYLVFFNESFPLQSPVDGAVRAKLYSQFMQLPLDGGNANLCKLRRVKTVSGGDNVLLIFDAKFSRSCMRRP